jgi:hypothetical protein
MHVTENYFEFSPDLGGLLDQLKLCLRLSNLAVAVSSGVASGIVAHVPEANITVVSNGCDYRAYAVGKPDEELTVMRRAYQKLAVYAGNINLRIDFDLLHSCAQRFPDILFVLGGPVTGQAGPNPLEPADQAVWERILQLPNCRYLGQVNPDRLPDLYAAADLGIIPYKDLSVIRESGFALKALEMLAAGLPVVSTLMRPLLGLTEALVVVDNTSDFHDRVETVSRHALSQQAQEHMDALCRANDYDEKFRQVLGSLAEILQPDAPTTSHIAPFITDLRGYLVHLQSLRAGYAQDRQNLVAEIQRLQTVWSEQNEWYSEQIQRLQAIDHAKSKQHLAEIERLGETIRERDLVIERLRAELQYFRRFRIAVRRIPGAAALLRSWREPPTV